MSEATFRTMRSLLHPSGGREEQTLIVPDYQRGYKWAVRELLSAGGVEANSALETLLSNLNTAFCIAKDTDYFLQGVTVRESADGLVLIDGQQRVTSFYLILWCLGGPDAIRPIRLQYDVRAASQRFLDALHDRQPDEFLPQLTGSEAEGEAEDEQDVYYFKQALRQIHSWWGKRSKEELKRLADWLLDRVRVIYLTVDTPEKAVRTFTMMNGAKATMLAEELAKAEALRRLATEGEPVEEEDEGDFGCAPTLDDCFDEIRQWAATQWETAARRGRCAREWDRWLYWWNRPDVQRFFNVQTPWGWLLDYALWDWSEGKTDRFSFEAFRSAFMRFLSDAQDCFERLRSIQTAVEDVYADPVAYNWLGLSLLFAPGRDEKFETLRYFLRHRHGADALARYAKCRLAGATHQEITGEGQGNAEEKERRLHEKQARLQHLLAAADAYNDDEAKAACFGFLLYLNLVEDNRLGRKFDFTVWGAKSLEHIWPKARVSHRDADGTLRRGDGAELTPEEVNEVCAGAPGWLDRAQIRTASGQPLSEHCVGNLVLLYGRDNSAFGARSYEEKKAAFFDVSSDAFRSRHLLHTVSKFASTAWGARQIADYYEEIQEQVKTLYHE